MRTASTTQPCRTLLAAIISTVCIVSVQAETLDTRIGKLEFTHAFIDGYPTNTTVEKLVDEMDFQRAVQAYIWSVPLVSMAQWRHAHEKELGAENGQIVFVESYKDKDGDWLDGGASYVLQVPADAPAETFWSITAYEVSTRTLINNQYEIADRSSRMDLAMNADGSVDIYIGPDKPEGTKAKNWIATEAGRAWFPYFRLYSPKQAFLDRFWVLPDIEKVQ